jgi:hypothetical protein
MMMLMMMVMMMVIPLLELRLWVSMGNVWIAGAIADGTIPSVRAS